MEDRSDGRMNFREFYRVRAPDRWGGIPARFSHSALARIESCPLKYQLEHSEFPVVGRFPSRPNSAAIEGSIVHECLELLFRGFSLAGLPELGSEGARDCSRRINLMAMVAEKLQFFHEALTRHPRGQGAQLRSSAQQIANKVVQLFRHQYTQIDRSGVRAVPAPEVSSTRTSVNPGDLLSVLATNGSLSELRLSHPHLPFDGIIDLAYRSADGTVIVDFKTGAEKREHLDQAYRYALLWWRSTSEIPRSIEIRYLDRQLASPISETRLIEVESSLAEGISRASDSLGDTPAKAILGAHCQYCDVRQFCKDYWAQRSESLTEGGRSADLELSVIGQPSITGFTAETSAGERVDVVFEPDIGILLFPPIQDRQTFRVIGARFDPQKRSLLVLPSTEVWSVVPKS